MIKGIIFDFNRTIFNPETNKLTKGTNKILNKLKHLKLCLISKNSCDRKKQINDLKLNKFFIDIQIIENDKEKKHFKKCLKLMKLKPNEILVIGDRIKKEILIGNQLKMITVWFKSGKFSEDIPNNKLEKPNYTITNLEEIIKLI
jgi:FMN phosphatase YigB (HAD superfamily)